MIIVDAETEKDFKEWKEMFDRRNKLKRQRQAQKAINDAYDLGEGQAQDDYIKHLDLVIADKWLFAHTHTPDFNFELSPEQIIEKALFQGLVYEFGENDIAIADPEPKESWRIKLDRLQKKAN